MPPVHNPAHMNELFKFIKILHDEQKKAWSAENPNIGKFTHCVEALSRSNWFKLEDPDINKLEETWAADKTIDFDAVGTYGNKVLFLPPLEKEDEFFVVMWMKCEMNPYSSQIRVMLIKRKSDEESIQEPKNRFWAVGFRVETGAGMHKYHHAQLMKDFKGHANASIFFDSIPWLPVTQPAFPLYATDPLTMMISLYVTLYGLDRFGKILIDHGPKLKEIKKVPSVKDFLNTISSTDEVAVAAKPRRK